MTISDRVRRPRQIRALDLVRAFGGARYAVAVAVDALGTGLLRPFLVLYGVAVLRLPVPLAGAALTAGVVAGLACTPAVGRWLDRGARSTAVAASMLVRVIGSVLLLAAPTGDVGLFTAAALFLGIGNQAFSTTHPALVTTVAHGRERDAALAAGRSVRNAGLGVGALVATAGLAGGTTALRALAGGTALTYLGAAVLAWSVRVRANPAVRPAGNGEDEPAPRLRALLAANVVYAFCLNVPEIALPLVLVTRLHASPMWAAGVFIANTVLVVTLQVPVTVRMAVLSRRTALVVAGLVLAASYVGFLGAATLGGGWAAPAVAAVSVPCTLGEIIYTGAATPLVAAIAPPRFAGRALARFQLSTGLGLAVSPAVITVLAAHGSPALWGTLAVATLLAAALIRRHDSLGRERVNPWSGSRRAGSHRGAEDVRPAVRR
ncbi:MFS transporter [Actinoallomurus soli]|uniref:MFS transporter n=1 Tax=Actinoallomurus soli TaxID=2952535 RepID=UPI00209304C6|nr:MFS transporter [Actinoallomurus soli]MCO5968334.1 MFS transporter [Actinoallomurus soli]